MNTKKLIRSLLFIFVAVSFAVLIYKEFLPRNDGNGGDTAGVKVDAALISDKFISSSVSEPLKVPVSKQTKESALSQTETRSQNSKVIAYYFHGTHRCTTCQTIEKYSQEAIEQYFSNELKNGKMVFKPLNVEEAENRHFIQDYQLFSKSLVISLVKDGKEVTWKNLTDVWKNVGDKERFFQYVKGEVEKFLKET